MTLTNENYFSAEADREYLSVSQYKSFMGTVGRDGCPAHTMAKLRGEWQDEQGTALLVGSYVDSHFEGTLPTFKAQHPEIFMKNGNLKADYRRAEEIINRIERDPYFMKYMSGGKQVIMAGKIGGAKWKIKIDSYIPDVCIVDLKVIKAIRESFYCNKNKVSFIKNWGYDIQAAVYQEIVRQNTGKKLPFYIAAASKESTTDIEIIQLSDNLLEIMLLGVEADVPQILRWKNGVDEPLRCDRCDYCKHTKVLTKPVLDIDLLLPKYMEDMKDE